MLPSGSRDSLQLLGENPYLSSQKINSRDSFSIAKFMSFLVNIQFAILYELRRKLIDVDSSDLVYVHVGSLPC